MVEADSDIQFSLSHCRDVALIAFTRGVPVGVDVEHVRPLADWKRIAARYLHPGERMELMALSEDERLTAFFRCWTRKEAVAKALGVGLSLPLNRCPPGAAGDAQRRPAARSLVLAGANADATLHRRAGNARPGRIDCLPNPRVAGLSFTASGAAKSSFAPLVLIQ
ncbi:MAG: 4'-phosphopantetheinyl transferase superfamily protein [Alphaproteobacteria bacterium]|nr:MAG: 4'-phosphopantetheinyl transferase superfamily protein [Alphaproteobacteria bacterium]